MDRIAGVIYWLYVYEIVAWIVEELWKKVGRKRDEEQEASGSKGNSDGTSLPSAVWLAYTTADVVHEAKWDGPAWPFLTAARKKSLSSSASSTMERERQQPFRLLRWYIYPPSQAYWAVIVRWNLKSTDGKAKPNTPLECAAERASNVISYIYIYINLSLSLSIYIHIHRERVRGGEGEREK